MDANLPPLGIGAKPTLGETWSSFMTPPRDFKEVALSLQLMKAREAVDEEVMRKIDRLMKDPAKWREYVEARAEKAIKHWPKR